MVSQERTSDVGEGQEGMKQPVEKKVEGKQEGGSLVSFLSIYDAMMSIDRQTALLVDPADFYFTHSSGKMKKTPLRDEVVGKLVEPVYRQVYYGDLWGYDGTIATPVSPIYGLSYDEATFAAMSYNPANWSDGNNWRWSLGGWLTKALVNNLRANNMVSDANLIKMVKYLIEMGQMARSVMELLIYNQRYDTNVLEYTVSGLLDGVAGDPLFKNKDDLISQLDLTTLNSVFMYPMLDFWAMRVGSQAYIRQLPWDKYFQYVPFRGLTYLQGLARFFGAYVGTAAAEVQWEHPEVYLRAQNCWNMFRDNILPNIFNRKKHYDYHGIAITNYLSNIGWTPYAVNMRMVEYLEQKFWLHPFDELLGVGEWELPMDLNDATVTYEDFYWDEDIQFVLRPDAFLTSSHNGLNCMSPWTDLFSHIYHVRANYSGDVDALDDPTAGHAIFLSVNDDGTVNEIDWETYLAFFGTHAFYFNQLETLQPDPDIEITPALLTLKNRGYTAHDIYRSNHDPTLWPQNMPKLRWFTDNKANYKYACAILNIKPDDVEQYKVQKERIESAIQSLE